MELERGTIKKCWCRPKWWPLSKSLAHTSSVKTKRDHNINKTGKSHFASMVDGFSGRKRIVNLFPKRTLRGEIKTFLLMRYCCGIISFFLLDASYALSLFLTWWIINNVLLACLPTQFLFLYQLNSMMPWELGKIKHKVSKLLLMVLFDSLSITLAQIYENCIYSQKTSLFSYVKLIN